MILFDQIILYYVTLLSNSLSNVSNITDGFDLSIGEKRVIYIYVLEYNM